MIFFKLCGWKLIVSNVPYYHRVLNSNFRSIYYRLVHPTQAIHTQLLEK